LATAKQKLANFLFRGAYTPGMDSTTFKLMRLQGAKVDPKFEDILAQDGIKWTDGERTKRTARSVCEPDSIQYNALANGVELLSSDLQMLGKGLVSIVGWLMELSMEPLAIDLWTREDVPKLTQDQEYRLAICQYILELAESILKGDADLGKEETDAHKLLVEFYWPLHQIPEYLSGPIQRVAPRASVSRGRSWGVLGSCGSLWGDSILQVRRPSCAAWPSSWGS
jgi:hypothetical protein